MSTSRRVLTAAFAAAAMVAAGQFAGCSSSGSNSLPTQPSLTDQSSLSAQPSLVYQPAASEAGVAFLDRQDDAVAARKSRGHGDRGNKWMIDQELITPDGGGTLTVGNSTMGYSSLSFPSGAVGVPVVITMKAKANGRVMIDFVFEPSGIHFLTPATLTMSYKGAKISDKIERAVKKGKLDELSIYLHQDASQGDDAGWVQIPSTWDPAAETVTAPIWHFSRYAIGSNG